MKFVKVATVDEFAQRSIKSVRLLGRPVAIVKEASGSFRAIEAGCKHQNADITKGSIKDGVATCPWHGWKYDLRTGECVWGSDTRLRHHHCKVENDNILISLQPIDKDTGEEETFIPFE